MNPNNPFDRLEDLIAIVSGFGFAAIFLLIVLVALQFMVVAALYSPRTNLIYDWDDDERKDKEA